MHTKVVQAKVRSSGPDSTKLVIRAHGTTVQAEFSELKPCEFPIWASAPVAVEIPPNGSKSFIVGPYSGHVTQKTVTGDLPSIIKFPVYREQKQVASRNFDELAPAAGSQLLVKTPVVALATAVSGVSDGKLVQVHCVLPFWNDGSTVLVRLDWYEGEPAEGTPNPEWHLSALGGAPATLGLEQLRDMSRLAPFATHCRYQINVTPWVLGADLLNDKGQQTAHPIWQREWAFDEFAEFSTALDEIRRGLLGTDSPDAQHTASKVLVGA